MGPSSSSSSFFIFAIFALLVGFAPLSLSHWTSIHVHNSPPLPQEKNRNDSAVAGPGGGAGVNASKYYVELHNFKNTMFYGNIEVGSPPQRFRVTFATGSADTWLPSTQCMNEACAEHVLFNASQSSTYRHINNVFNITYTPGMIMGSTGADIFNISGCMIRTSFGEISRAARSFQAKYRWFPFDGIVGLSFAGASVSGETPLFDALMNNSLVAESVFSLYLTQSPHTPGSTLVLGGTDPKFHLDELNFFPVEQPLVFWMLRLSKISLRESATSAASALNRKTLLSLCETSDNRKRTREEKHHNYCKAVIDSGTSMISGPTAAVNQLSAFIKLDPVCRNVDQLPVLAFHFAGITYPLHPEDYVMQIRVKDTVACFLGIQAYDFPEQMGPMWVLGNTFLRKYYTVFDRKHNQIGFAIARPR